LFVSRRGGGGGSNNQLFVGVDRRQKEGAIGRALMATMLGAFFWLLDMGGTDG